MFGLTQVNAFADTLSFQFKCFDGKDVQVVPIAMLFSAVFGLLLLIQFIGMLYHRFSTLIHISASTNIFETAESRESKLNDQVVELLISPEEPKPVPPQSNLVSDKNRKQLDKNRTIMADKQKSFVHLNDVVQANTARMTMLQGTLYKKHNDIANKILSKWQALAKLPKVAPGGKRAHFGDVVDFAKHQNQHERKKSLDLSDEDVKRAGIRSTTPGTSNSDTRVEHIHENSSSDDKSSPEDSNV